MPNIPHVRLPPSDIGWDKNSIAWLYREYMSIIYNHPNDIATVNEFIIMCINPSCFHSIYFKAKNPDKLKNIMSVNKAKLVNSGDPKVTLTARWNNETKAPMKIIDNQEFILSILNFDILKPFIT